MHLKIGSLKNQIIAFKQSISKPQLIVELGIILCNFLLFFSIPACSFSDTLYKITWVLTILLILLIVLDYVFIKKIVFNIVQISLLLFCVSAFISTALNGFRHFSPTYFYLTFFTVITYTFCISRKALIKPLLLSIFAGITLFLFVFIIKYYKELFTFNFDRLGIIFGDINDIAIFNCLGFMFSLWFFFKIKNIPIKIALGLLSLIFAYCSFASGSKIVVLLFPILLVYLIIVTNKKKKWWLSLIEISIMLVVFVIVMNLPFAESLKRRFLSMLNLFTDSQIKGADATDGSTVGRINMFLDGCLMFLRKPLFGFGVNGFANFGGITHGWSHNHISEILCNTGLLGFLFYHVPMFLAIKTKKVNSISFLTVVFSIVCMISIVLITEKMFAFLFGVVYAEAIETKPILQIDIFKIFKRKELLTNENNGSN